MNSLVETFSENIPSLCPSNSHLQVSINNVKVVGSPIYDDGFVVVFGIDFENFIRTDTNRNPNFNPTPQCISFDPFCEVSLLLKSSKGYSIMSLFSESQLIGFLKNSSPGLSLTAFALMDDAIVGDFPEYQQLFFRHLVPSVLYWTDLFDIANGTEFKNYVNGLSLKITKVNHVSFVNGVEITYLDLYYDDWLVLHGLQSLIPLPDEIADEMDENPGKHEDMVAAPDRSEF